MDNGGREEMHYRDITAGTFRVTVSALLSLVGPAHQLLLPLAAFKCDVF